MSKIYEIEITHYSPKDSVTGILCYYVANSEEKVYQKINGLNYGSWDKINDKNKYYDIYDESGLNIIKENASYKELIMNKRGDINMEVDLSSSFYGVTCYGWSEGKDISEKEIETLSKFIKIEILQ